MHIHIAAKQEQYLIPLHLWIMAFHSHSVIQAASHISPAVAVPAHLTVNEKPSLCCTFDCNNHGHETRQSNSSECRPPGFPHPELIATSLYANVQLFATMPKALTAWQTAAEWRITPLCHCFNSALKQRCLDMRTRLQWLQCAFDAWD